MALNEGVISEPRHAGVPCLRVGNAALSLARWKSRLSEGRKFVKYASSCDFLFSQFIENKSIVKKF
jgi:hypothetical protein